MKRIGPTMYGSDSRYSRTETHQSSGRDAESKERRRREWKKQQEMEREHERLKKQKIEEWEKNRKDQERQNSKGRISFPSRSKNIDCSSSNHRTEDSPNTSSKPSVMSQKFESQGNNTRLFKGPEGTKIDIAKLRCIKVDIHRNIPGAEISHELQREILDPEDVKLKRRDEEGSVPLFEREEIMTSKTVFPKVDKHHTNVDENENVIEKRLHSTRRRLRSLENIEKPQHHYSRRDSDTPSPKFQSLINATRLFKDGGRTTIDIAELRSVKVEILRNIPDATINTKLIELRLQEGEGAKPIFEREELIKSEASASEVQERRTVVALDGDKTEKKPHWPRKRSTSSSNSHKQPGHNSRRDSDAHYSRRENSKHNVARSESYRSQRHESERRRSGDRSRDRHARENSRERLHGSRDVSRDHGDRHNRSRSRNRDSRRDDIRRRSSRDRTNSERNRDHRDYSRDRRSHENRSRERNPPMQHHYAETIPIPLYYDGFHPRPIMMGPMMSIRGQMPMGRGRMPVIMGPIRPPFPPRFMSQEMFRSALNPNHRFGRMF